VGDFIMTISKQLFLITALIMGIPFNTFTYDVVGLKQEVQLILDFANHADFYIENNDRNINLGQWLKNKIDRTYKTSNHEIIKIANIIKTHTHHEELLKMEAEEYATNQTIHNVIIAGFVAAYITLTIVGFQQELNRMINRRIFSSELRNLVLIDKIQEQNLGLIDKLQEQINALAQKA
jgi:hypothetical protein